MSTAEIAKAVQNLDAKTIQKALTAIGTEVEGKDLVGSYQNAVLKTGIKNFVGKLSEKDLKAASKVLGLQEESKKEEGKAALEEGLLVGSGLNGLLTKANDDLLCTFCDTLGLTKSEKTAMIKEIADEVMLTGMESFLNSLKLDILRPHCSELKLPTGGAKKDLVERLMVHIFELEPLEEGEKEKEKEAKKEPKKGKSKAPKKEKKGKKTEKKEEKEEEEEDSKDKKEEESKEGEEKKPEKPKAKKSKKEDKVKGEPKKREKFVAPPLETIGQKFTTYVDLYDNFNLPDLAGYCKNNNLKTAGKKKEVIHRILLHLKGETEKPKQPKKRKATGAAAKTAKKSKTEKKEGESTEAKEQ